MSRLRLLVVGVASCLSAGLFSLAAWPAGALAVGASSSAGSSSLLLESPLTVPGGELLFGGEQWLLAEAARRASPEAVVARAASASAFEGLPARAAERLAGEAFPGLVREANGGLPRLPAGQQVSKLLAANVAKLSLPNGHHELLESAVPVAVRSPSGGWAPIDLGLQAAGGAFQPRRPAVSVRIPVRLGEGPRLLDSGVSLTPIDGHGAPLGGAPGVVDGASVFYGDSEDRRVGVFDVDALVKADLAGFSLETILRSERSPRRLLFRVGLPAGARLVRAGDGSVRVVAAGRTVAQIPLPAARDAEGAGVPVATRVSGDLLALTLSHAQGRYRFPIAVDPSVTDSQFKNELYGGTLLHTNWHFAHEGSAFSAPEHPEGESWTESISGSHSSTEWGGLFYTTRGESVITYAHVEGRWNDTGSHIQNYMVLYAPAHTESYNPNLPVDSEENWPGEDVGASVCSPEMNCPETVTAGTAENENSAAYEQESTGAGGGVGGWNTLKSGYVQISQTRSPELGFNTTSATLWNGSENVPNVLYGAGGWLGPHNGAFEVHAKDFGIGIGFYRLLTFGWKDERRYWEKGECFGVQCPPEINQGYVYDSKMPDGEDSFEALAEDKVGLYAFVYPQKIKVDGTAPNSLKVAGLPASNALTQIVHVQGQATDGSGSTPSSGVKSLELGVDGIALEGGKSGSCSLGPCTVSGEWTLDPEDFGAGKHTLELVATDNAGNKTVTKYEITVRHAGSISAGPGSVDPITGAMTLNTSDVSIGGGYGALEVSRSFDSRQPTAGEEGPLGPQWSLSLGGDQGIEEEPTGDVTLVGTDGSLTTFTSDGKGGFISPKGDENLTLSAELEGTKVKAYLLKDPAKGTTLKFVHPSGASSESPWVIEKAEGSQSSSETQTYKWEAIEGIERPKQALAPAPPGVSCEPELKTGCRALSFTYATSTTATGEAPSEWGEYKGRLTKVSFTAYDPVSKAMKTTAVAEYAYDKQGRLRAEWDPRISPALKTTYGYDSEGRVVAVNPPGLQPWLLHYGSLAGDPGPGRLLSAIHPSASTALGSGPAPANETKPTLSTTAPVVGTTLSVATSGSWSHSPLVYAYQWQDCNAAGEGCAAIPGAVNQSYTPQEKDAGYTLIASVTAINGNGATTASTVHSNALAGSTPSFSLKFGSFGEGAGQMKNPAGAAVDASGNVWVSDHNNNRIDQFSASGAFVKTVGWGVANGELKLQTCTSSCRAGIAGSNNGQLSAPDGLAISGEDVYVADAGNNRIEELTTAGAFVRGFGSAGSEPGQLKTPVAVAVDRLGNVWVADRANNRIEQFTETGSFIGSVGSLGAGNGQFKEPSGIAFSGEYVFVVDSGNSRVQKFTLSGSYVSQFGSAGTGNGQFKAPAEIATEPVSGDLYVADNGNNRIQEFNPAGTFLASVGSLGEGNGQFKGVEGIAVTSSGTLYAADLNDSRVQKFTPTYSTNNPAPAPPSAGTSAISTIDYQVPVSGTGAPYALSAGETAKWAQTDNPVEATAVFPPDEPMGWPAQDYKRASISYFDNLGRTVNTASPSGAISTSEYNETNNAIRTLSAANRAQALKEGAKSAEVAKLLDTQRTYNAEGTELLETLGSEHKVKLSSGSEVGAREHVVNHYDEGAPAEGGPYRLLTKSTDGAKYSTTEADIRTTVNSYSGQENLGWKLRKPTSVTTDPSGLKLVHTTVYDPITGNVTETRQPGSEVAATYVSQFGSEGAGNGQFKSPWGVAVDSAGHVWVADSSNNRVQEFSSEGVYIRQFGSEGAGNGQFKSPDDVAVDSQGHVWVADTSNNRVQEFSSEGVYIRQFGSEGAGNGQFKSPRGVAADSTGHVWVVDTINSRVQEFSSEGAYIRQFGSFGGGNGQFNLPMGIAVDSAGHIWVADSFNDRVQEFSSEGAYIRQFGSAGTGIGQLKYPKGIAVDSAGHVWVADTNNSRVLEFSSEGAYIGQFGSEGAGNGQLKKPQGIAVDGAGHVWVADSANSRVQELTSAPLLPAYTLQFGSYGAGNGQLKKPLGIAVDGAGHVWVADSNNNRVQEFSSEGAYIRQFGSSGTGNGQFSLPIGIAVDSAGHVWVVDNTNNRVQKFSSEGVYIRQFGSYGTGNGQFKFATGIAVDSAGHVWVVDALNNRVQEFSSEGVYIRQFGSSGTGNGQLKSPWGVAMDSAGHVWVADTNNSRVQEFSSEGAYIGQFGSEGAGKGQLKKPRGIAVDGAGHVWVADSANNRVQEFSSEGAYIRQFGPAGTGNGQFNEPQGIAVDGAGHVWVSDTINNRVQEFAPVLLGASNDSQTSFYTAGVNAADPSCGNHPEWANLPCQTQPAAQPEAGSRLPVVTDTYNTWDEPETVTEEFGSTTRTKKSVYDAAGRPIESEVTSSLGTALPKVVNEYSSETGAMVKQSTTVAEKTKTITSAYNKLGQLTEYTDADANKSTYAYDVDGRVSEMSDGKGTQVYAYDPTTGALIKLLDTAAGTFTASYDVVGRLTSEIYPNGMSAKYSYDELGETTHGEYVKETHCASTCPETWFSEGVAYSIHGEALSRSSSLASESYAYDNAGRLTEVKETPAGKGCKVRLYAYDVDSNRLSLTSREPGTEGQCTTSGGTVESHTYDEADRLSDTGTSYDAFGNTLTLPAADAEGHEVKSTYYVSNQTRSTTQNGKTILYELDPDARPREVVTEEGASKTTVVNHYPGAGQAIAWTAEGGEKYTRNIPGIDGTLSAVEQSGQTPVLQLHDLQGNVVATAALSETETKLLSTYNSTEFGVPVNGAPPKYSWLGASGLTTEFASGTSSSTGTGYVPQLGRALQTQPIEGPGAFSDGTVAAGVVQASYIYALSNQMKARAIEEEAARQRAAEEEAWEAAGEAEEGAEETGAAEGIEDGGEAIALMSITSGIVRRHHFPHRRLTGTGAICGQFPYCSPFEKMLLSGGEGHLQAWFNHQKCRIFLEHAYVTCKAALRWARSRRASGGLTAGGVLKALEEVNTAWKNEMEANSLGWGEVFEMVRAIAPYAGEAG